MGRKPINKNRLDDPTLKQHWVEQLSRIYFQNGLLRFTMEEMAGHLGISKATLYKYFASKDEILDAVVQAKIREITIFENLLSDEEITFTERYFDFIKTASMMLAEISPRFLADARDKQPELWERIRSFQDRALLAAETFYRQGIQTGILNPLSPRLLALTDKMFINAVSDPDFLKTYGLSLKEAFDGFFTMKSKGIFK